MKNLSRKDFFNVIEKNMPAAFLDFSSWIDQYKEISGVGSVVRIYGEVPRCAFRDAAGGDPAIFPGKDGGQAAGANGPGSGVSGFYGGIREAGDKT